ncbi:uncharacterized protein AB675_1404 [Cyphellophora attinorum]|uniref:Uncharacterized protein n=1 Tax=Cyphellophora attinorum TaxID=1664694 RepID=A0A0N1GWV8_9EURO|nr:uncharacterized protein AB675_1404 [Phialophora attinorum]KPI34455.1 hypothetical protein AB675_1404 [Phialophora attinorum]
MPPKRVTRRRAAQRNAEEKPTREQQHSEEDEEPQNGDETNGDDSNAPEPGDKRKAEDIEGDADDQEAASEGAEDAEPEAKKPKTEPAPSNKNGNSASSSQPRALKWLLSQEAFDLAFPAFPEGHGEIDWDDEKRRKEPPAEDAGHQATKDQKLLTYPDSSLTPFQNLVCALILSKPLSHRLGTRTINTLLNPPFGLRTVDDLDEAGFEGRRKVMWEARTQHKEKTATQLGDLVEGVRAICGDDDLENLEGLRKQLKGLDVKAAQDKVQEVLTDGIKGVGPTGVGIFLRRVQGQWEEVFPYVDDRALAAAREFGLVDGNGKLGSARDLAKLLNDDQAEFVKLLDVLIGIQLEKKMDEALKTAGVKT